MKSQDFRHWAALEFRRILATPRPPTIAAIHESGHETAARHWGCFVQGTFVDRDGLNGHIRFTVPDSVRDARGWLVRDPCGVIRRSAAISLAGVAAEQIAAGEPVADYEQLLRLETCSEVWREYEHGLIERYFCAASAAFRHDHHRGGRWLEAVLTGLRRQVIEVLRARWPALIVRARDLDREAATS